MRVALALFLLVWGSALHAADCRQDRFDNADFTICEVDLTRDTLRLFLYDRDGAPFGHFSTLNKALQAEGKQLGFAMNAGMYHDDRRPVGLFIEDGAQAQKLITRAGSGNFGLVPNGVLCLRDQRADVIETKRFAAKLPKCRDATQSGPMLVIDGNLHPRFLKDSTSRYIRNGVGTTANGRRAIFAISDTPVTFHHFGRLFRDHLSLDNALYLDGNISRVRAPDLGRSDIGFTTLGPIIGVVEPAK